MAALKNARHELFAQELAKGMAASRAYVAAGYSENGARTGASLLLAKPSISARVAEIQAKIGRKLEITIETQLEKAERALAIAERNEKAGDMVRALMAQAQLLGLVVEKRENHNFNHDERLEDVQRAIERRRLERKGIVIPSREDRDGRRTLN